MNIDYKKELIVALQITRCMAIRAIGDSNKKDLKRYQLIAEVVKTILKDLED